MRMLQRDAAEILAHKIRKLRRTMRKWENRCFGSVNNIKKEITKEVYILDTVQEVRELSQEKLANLQSLRVKVHNIYRKEEIMWSQIDKVN